MTLNKDRRKHLEKTLPEGIVVTRKWLESSLHLHKHAIDNLVKSEYLKSIHKGYYVRGVFIHSWQAVVYSLQQTMSDDFMVGGMSALSLQGFLTTEPTRLTLVELYGKAKLPSWLEAIGVQGRFVKYVSKTFFSEFTPDTSARLTTLFLWREELSPLKISCKEKAFLEFLGQVSDEFSFEQAVAIFQKINGFESEKWQILLEKCLNIKIKRLALWLIHQYQPAWLIDLDLSKVYLGSGNRMVIKNGRLDPTYKITIPKAEK